MRALYNIFDHIFDLNDVRMLYIMHIDTYLEKKKN